jgi:RNA-binding protein 48
MQESKYLVVTNIPSVGAHNDLIRLFKVYGTILEHRMLDEYPCEAFCETMLIKFEKIQNARCCKSYIYINLN